MWYSAVGVIVTLTLSILAAPLVTNAQPAGQCTASGGSVLALPALIAPPLSMPSGRGGASSAMSRARTSSWSIVGRRGRTSASLPWRLSWPGSRWR